jgi:hypothetical protein
MKVSILRLKAPGPVGAQVGHVVEFEGNVPAWAVGKCKPAPDDAEVYVPVEPVKAPEPEFVLPPTVDPVIATAEAQAEDERMALSAAPKRKKKAEEPAPQVDKPAEAQADASSAAG